MEDIYNKLQELINIAYNSNYLHPQLLPKLKKGNKIYIKKKNRGKFTEYCGGKVTDECI